MQVIKAILLHKNKVLSVL